MIPVSKPVINQEMIDAAKTALENEFLVMGESVHKFEEAFAKYCGSKHAISVGSGTAALHMSIIALVQQKEITTTPMSFIATANSIVHANKTPIFKDIESDTGNIDLNGISTRAVMPVHLYGNPCDMEKLKEMKENHIIIEDACEAHGAEYNGKKLGTFGDVGCFSFYSTKNMTVGGDGGMVITDNDETADKLRSLRDTGRSKNRYEHTSIGFTSRLNTVNAAIGLVQLKHLDEWNNTRKKLAEIYKNMLPKEILLRNTNSVHYVFVIKSEKRQQIADALSAAGVKTSIHFPPIHLQPAYKHFSLGIGTFPVAEDFAEKVLSIPMYPDMKEDDAKMIAEKINEVVT